MYVRTYTRVEYRRKVRPYVIIFPAAAGSASFLPFRFLCSSGDLLPRLRSPAETLGLSRRSVFSSYPSRACCFSPALPASLTLYLSLFLSFSLRYLTKRYLSKYVSRRNPSATRRPTTKIDALPTLLYISHRRILQISKVLNRLPSQCQYC